MKKLILVLILLIISLITPAMAEEPFQAEAKLDYSGSETVLVLDFKMAENHYLYKEQISVESAGGVEFEALDHPEAKVKKDQFSGEERHIYDKDFILKYRVKNAPEGALKVTINYQGCKEDVCFRPQSKEFTLGGGKASGSTPGAVKPAGKPGEEETSWQEEARNFKVIGTGTGFMPPDKFLGFLENAGKGTSAEKDGFHGKGIWLTLALIVLGGLALNLTPCVLPMIPINLMIIGAGAQAGSKGKGFLLGGMYGLGIALSYGVLGLVVVLTGSKFGALQSSPWFNAAIAVVFIVLSLAMFNVIILDFSKYGSKVNVSQEQKGTLWAAFFLGIVMAMLAGACVAPAVISVLLLSSSLYAQGNIAGLLLPFLLGVGMALPWPFAGAGISFLPKPGMWMEKVKYVFGIIILLFAFYYGFLAYKGFAGTKFSEAGHEQSGEYYRSISEGLEAAHKEGKPVIIDFGASWCKSCSQMDKVTFKDHRVKEKLKSYVVIKYQAEDYRNAETKKAMDYYEVMGLPTFVILKPVENQAQKADENKKP